MNASCWGMGGGGLDVGGQDAAAGASAGDPGQVHPPIQRQLADGRRRLRPADAGGSGRRTGVVGGEGGGVGADRRRDVRSGGRGCGGRRGGRRREGGRGGGRGWWREGGRGGGRGDRGRGGRVAAVAVFEDDEDLADLHDVAGGEGQGDDLAGDRGGEFDEGLVGLDLDQRLVP